MRRRILISIALLPLLACGGGGSRPPNVLVIVLDTVRADHLGCYAGGSLTPRLDELAAASTRYQRCAASSPWTVPSHASMFTGLDPHAHGAHSFLVDEFQGVDNVFALAEEHVTLAEVLRDEGFVTGGVVANASYLKPAFGLAQGFTDWKVTRVRAPEINAEALDWIDGVEKGRSWLLFLNYMDAHRPYNVEPLQGEEAVDPARFSSVLLDGLYQDVMVDGRPSDALAAEVRRQYARAVRNLDRALGKLFDDLKSRGLWEETVVVLTSDHGEYFGEHGLVEHSKDVYEEAISVPLLVKGHSSESGRVVSEWTSNAHLPRIVLGELGGVFQERHAGRFPLAPGAGVMAENYYSRLPDILHPRIGERFRRVREAYYEGDYKLIRSSDDAHELYRLDVDPGEERDRAGTDAVVLERMLTALRERTTGRAFAGGAREMVGGAAHMNDLEESGYAGWDEDSGD